MSTDTKYEALQEIGKRAAESLAEMVAALECDYDRLEELKGAQSDFNAARETPTSGEWHEEFSEDYAELTELIEAAGECKDREDAGRRIQEDPLSVEVRSGWYPIGLGEEPTPEEFMILLGTGGPATRIIGELDNNEPHRAGLQVQDWGRPWADYTGDAISCDDLLTYCRCFYFGEG